MRGRGDEEEEDGGEDEEGKEEEDGERGASISEEQGENSRVCISRPASLFAKSQE